MATKTIKTSAKSGKIETYIHISIPATFDFI